MNIYLLEFLGNMILVLIILSTGNNIAISIVLVLGVYLGGAATTGNPAVILALYRAKQINFSELIFFILSEILGCLAGFEVYRLIY